MIILHAGVLDGKLLLWAETNIKEPDTITVKKSRQKTNPRTGSSGKYRFLQYRQSCPKGWEVFPSGGLKRNSWM